MCSTVIGKLSKVKNLADAAKPLWELTNAEDDQTNYYSTLTQMDKAYTAIHIFHNDFKDQVDTQVLRKLDDWLKTDFYGTLLGELKHLKRKYDLQ